MSVLDHNTSGNFAIVQRFSHLNVDLHQAANAKFDLKQGETEHAVWQGQGQTVPSNWSFNSETEIGLFPNGLTPASRSTRKSDVRLL
jgi:hypothetical protein